VAFELAIGGGSTFFHETWWKLWTLWYLLLEPKKACWMTSGFRPQALNQLEALDAAAKASMALTASVASVHQEPTVFAQTAKNAQNCLEGGCPFCHLTILVWHSYVVSNTSKYNMLCISIVCGVFRWRLCAWSWKSARKTWSRWLKHDLMNQHLEVIYYNNHRFWCFAIFIPICWWNRLIVTICWSTIVDGSSHFMWFPISIEVFASWASPAPVCC
jgi:hypothetical protein